MENSIISFKDVCFSNKMLFQYAIIDNEIRLDHSLFRDVADFSHADFQDIRINNVIFNNRNSEKITFRGAHFAKSLLEEVEFNAAVSFEQAFFEIATFVKTKFNVGADFNFVTFKSGDDVLFDIEDLSKISFLNTDISRVHFHEDAVWGTPAFRFKILEEYNLDKAFEYAKRIQSLINNNNLTADKYHNFKVGDEIPSDEIPNSELRVVEIKGNNKVIKVKDSTDKEFTYILERHFDEINVHPKMSVGGIRSLYRALRENYDYWLRHEEANQVYWREMEIQRIYREIAPRPKKKKSTDEDEIKSKKNAWIRRNFSSTGLYRRVSDYGMSYLKPIFIAALAIAFPVAWEVYGSYEATLHPVASDANLTAVQNETATTRQNQTAEKIEEVAAKRLADTLGIESDELVGYFARAIAFSVVGVLAISAIKNKFERKSRK